MSEKQETTWVPPFAASVLENVECPKCSGDVYVRAKDSYLDGDMVDAYCDDCHAALEVLASVEITFSDVETADDDAEPAVAT
jgi:hypothetical protein